MQHFKLCIITSANKYSIEEWEDMEAIMMQTLRTTQDHGGINIISEKTYKQKQYHCDQCDFRTNHPKHILSHNIRTHSDYKVLCDQCGYMSNQLVNLKRHIIAKHP